MATFIFTQNKIIRYFLQKWDESVKLNIEKWQGREQGIGIVSSRFPKVKVTRPYNLQAKHKLVPMPLLTCASLEEHVSKSMRRQLNVLL